MKLLVGLVMAITVAVAPATGLTQDNSTSKQGADMVTVTMETSKGVIPSNSTRKKRPILSRISLPTPNQVTMTAQSSIVSSATS